MTKTQNEVVTVERKTVLVLPAGLVAQIIREHIGAPMEAEITSASGNDIDGFSYLPGARVSWTVVEPAAHLVLAR